ncbi:hypothetical protein ACP70R_000435 [Stipagrostis hirtigluma subsp. patula]
MHETQALDDRRHTTAPVNSSEGYMDHEARRRCPSTPPWTELPGDALSEIAGRFHDAADFVRFHAVCRPWREAPPPPREPTFFPFLLVQDGSSDTPTMRLHSPFSRKTRSAPLSWPLAALRGKMLKSPAAAAGDRVLALGCSNDWDRTAMLINQLTGDAVSLPPLPEHISPGDAWRCTDGFVSNAGDVVIHTAQTTKHRACFAPILLRPGETYWKHADLTCLKGMGTLWWLTDFERRATTLCCSGVLHGGACAMARLPLTIWEDFDADGYVLEFQGELLYVKVVHTPPSPMVLVYALEVGGGGTPRWVLVNSRRDLRHMCMFLDKMSYSGFAVDARKFTGAEVTGGYAYIVEREWIGRDSMHVVRRYGLENGRVTVVDKLQSPFDRRSIWYTPRPRISQLRSRRA